MKLLLTSSGVSNPSIEDALVDLLGKPIADSSALVVPTAIYPFPDGPGGAWRAISGQTESPFSGLGWESLGVLELTALPSIKEESWVPKLRETDALLVWAADLCVGPAPAGGAQGPSLIIWQLLRATGGSLGEPSLCKG